MRGNVKVKVTNAMVIVPLANKAVDQGVTTLMHSPMSAMGNVFQRPNPVMSSVPHLLQNVAQDALTLTVNSFCQTFGCVMENVRAKMSPVKESAMVMTRTSYVMENVRSVIFPAMANVSTVTIIFVEGVSPRMSPVMANV